jgi:hypothetical protein
MRKQLAIQRALIEKRIAPVIQRDALGQQLRAHAVRLAGDRIDAQAMATHNLHLMTHSDGLWPPPHDTTRLAMASSS